MVAASIFTCLSLVRRDMTVFWPTFLDRFINGAIWVVLTVLIFEHLFPQMGMAQDFAVFMACANIMSWGFFEVMGNVAILIADLTGPKAIEYDFTLPMPQWLVFTRIAISNGLQAMAIAIFILPLSKLVLWNSFSLAHVSWIQFTAIFILGNLFYGFFSLWLASMTKNMDAINNIWMCVVFPLWWVGGYQFSWQTMYDISPWLGRLNLLNPLVYVFEGIRASILGQAGYINVWYCVGALILASIITGYIGTKKMMERLDCL